MNGGNRVTTHQYEPLPCDVSDRRPSSVTFMSAMVPASPQLPPSLFVVSAVR